MRIPLLLKNQSISNLQARTKAPLTGPLWDRLVSRWQELAAREDVQNGSCLQGDLGWYGATPRVVDAALIHAVTGQAEALEYVVMMTNHLVDRYSEIKNADDLEAWRRQGGNYWKPETRAPHWNHPIIHSHSQIALAADLCEDRLPASTRKGIMRIMREVIIDYHDFDYALAGYLAGANIPCCQNLNAGIAALLWGERCGHPEWKTVVEKSIDSLRQYLRHGCDRDGFSYEGVGYSHGVFNYIYFYAQLLRMVGLRDLFLEEPLLEKIPDAAQHMLQDNHQFVLSNNDQGTCEPWTMWWLVLTAKTYNRPDHLGVWHAFMGPDHPIRPYGDSWPWIRQYSPDVWNEKPDPSLLAAFLWWDETAPVQPIVHSPLPLSQCAPGAGIATFRTGWDVDGVAGGFWGGARGRTSCHAHRDCGHVSLSAYGEYLAIDTGRYNYLEDQHSVILIDGKDRRPIADEGAGMSSNEYGGRLAAFEHHGWLDYCYADASLVKDAYSAVRDCLFIRYAPDAAYMVLLDNIVTDNLPHRYLWQLQVHPETRISIESDRFAQVHGKNARLDVNFITREEAPTDTVSNDFTLRSDIQEWVWPYGRDFDTTRFENSGVLMSSSRRPRLLADFDTVNCLLMSIISPRRAAEPPLTIRHGNQGLVFWCEVDTGSFTDTIISAADHGYVDIPGYYGFTELAVIRRDQKGRLLKEWHMGGDQFKVRG